MLQDTETCTKCGREKSRRMLGSVTQWLLDVDSCTCDRLKVAPEFNQEIELCSDCGLRKPSGRPGSMTQWIFSASICKCQAPFLRSEANEKADSGPGELDTGESSAPGGGAIGVGSAALESSQGKTLETTEPEPSLDLDPTRFPAERYRGIKVLGKGGSGFVYLCHDRLLGKKVAVKTLRQLTAEQLISFQTEARANSKLNHPAILTLLDFGPTESGSPYMVLEYFESITLADYLEEQGPLCVIDTVHVFERVTSALSAAHEQGVFHRDLKPSNILLSTKVTGEPPEVKLIDFGVAEIQRNTMPTITIEGRNLAGTPSYMAPDTFLGRAYDARSEVYSLGCVLFESLSGTVPFQGESAMEVLNQHATKIPPSLSDVLKMKRGNPVDPEVDALLSRCLEKDPAMRFASMQELHAALIHLPSSPSSGRAEPATAIKAHRKLNKAKLALIVIPLSLLASGACITFTNTQAPGNIAANEDLSIEQSTDAKRGEKREAVSGSSQASEKDTLAYFEHTALGNPELEEETAGSDPKKQFILGEYYRHGTGVPKNRERALYWYRKAAENGNLAAMCELGWMYQCGSGVEENHAKALEWYQKAADRNSSLAMGNIGSMYQEGEGVEQNFHESIRWFRKAVALGDAAAQNKLGIAYRDGLGVGQNDEEAVRLFKLSAAQNNSNGITNLAEMYQLGRGVEQDVNMAIELYKKASSLGDIFAMHEIGEIYEYGILVPRNYKKAVEFYSAASSQGNSLSTNALGWLYQNGFGVAKDYKKAMELYLMAKRGGSPTATCNLGQLYEKGLGVPINPKRAFEYYKEAADIGSPRGFNDLGRAYQQGIGVKPNYKEAVRLYKQAAELDDELAIDNLACLYRDGLGVTQNLPEAVRLFKLATTAGCISARFHLGECFENGIGVKKDIASARTWYESAAKREYQPAVDKLNELGNH